MCVRVCVSMCLPLIRSTMPATTTTMKHLLDTFCVVVVVIVIQGQRYFQGHGQRPIHHHHYHHCPRHYHDNRSTPQQLSADYLEAIHLKINTVKYQLSLELSSRLAPRHCDQVHVDIWLIRAVATVCPASHVNNRIAR